MQTRHIVFCHLHTQYSRIIRGNRLLSATDIVPRHPAELLERERQREPGDGVVDRQERRDAPPLDGGRPRLRQGRRRGGRGRVRLRQATILSPPQPGRRDGLMREEQKCLTGMVKKVNPRLRHPASWSRGSEFTQPRAGLLDRSPSPFGMPQESQRRCLPAAKRNHKICIWRWR